MRLSTIGEFGLIEAIRKRCRKSASGIVTGIGDDAAVLTTGKRNTAVTTDMMIEGVHFSLSFTTFFQLGHKFLAVNISDIHAMGGRPEYFFIGLGVPAGCRAEDIKELYEGIMNIAGRFGVTVAGGDTCSSGSGLILSGTLIGSAKRVITRAGAKQGDGIYVTETMGDSAMGLHLLKRRNRRVRKFSPASWNTRLLKKHLMPEPAPLKNALRVTSMIDISDGLLVDLGHICEESGVGAVIYRDRIPLSPELLSAAARLKLDPYAFALKGGEDYALLYTSPPGAKTKCYKIGEIIKKGRYIEDGSGRRTQFKAEGYEHFKK